MTERNRKKWRDTPAGVFAQYFAVVVVCLGFLLLGLAIAGTTFGLFAFVDWTPWWKGLLTFLGYSCIAAIVMVVIWYLAGRPSGIGDQIVTNPNRASRFIGKLFVGLYYLVLWFIGFLLLHVGLSLIGIEGRAGAFIALGLSLAVAGVLFYRTRH
jgi:hypothetical protein